MIASGFIGAVVALAGLVGLGIFGLNALINDPAVENLVDSEIPAVISRLEAVEQQLVQDPLGALDIDGLVKQLEDAAGVAEASINRQIDEEVEQLNASIRQLEDRVAGEVEQAVDLSAITKQLDELASQIERVDAALEALPAAGGPELEQMAQRVEQLADDGAAASGTLAQVSEAVDRLSARFDDEFSQRLQELETRLQDAAASRGLVASVSGAALRAAVDSGSPFMAQIANVQSLVGSSGPLTQLKAYAETGISTVKQLADRFVPVSRAILDTEQPEPSGGFFDRLFTNARSLVTVRPVGVGEGDSVAAIVSRIEAHLAAGRLQGVVEEWNGLPDPAKLASSNWMHDVKARIEAERLVEQVLGAVDAQAANDS